MTLRPGGVGDTGPPVTSRVRGGGRVCRREPLLVASQYRWRGAGSRRAGRRTREGGGRASTCLGHGRLTFVGRCL